MRGRRRWAGGDEVEVDVPFDLLAARLLRRLCGARSSVTRRR